jgi:hypothetical protein
VLEAIIAFVGVLQRLQLRACAKVAMILLLTVAHCISWVLISSKIKSVSLGSFAPLKISEATACRMANASCRSLHVALAMELMASLTVAFPMVQPRMACDMDGAMALVQEIGCHLPQTHLVDRIVCVGVPIEACHHVQHLAILLSMQE